MSTTKYQIKRDKSKDMEVPKELLEKWKQLRAHGDTEKIASSMPEETRVSDETIRRVFSQGQCNDDVFKAMASFYEERAEMIKQYL
jgi:hypothetical protein